jgi:hypothetical protein
MRGNPTFSEQVREYETRLICEALAHTGGLWTWLAYRRSITPRILFSR